MYAFSSLSKNLIAVSLVSALLVIWLGSRYWSDARNQFSGASQLELSVAPETTLFDIAASLDRERSAVQHALVGAERFKGDLNHLRALASQSKSLFERLLEEIETFRAVDSAENRTRYSDETIDHVIAELKDKFKRTSIARSVVAGQLYLPIIERDDSARMRLFDAHGNSIKSVNNLRQRLRSYPERNFIGVLDANDIKDSIWTLRESVNQTNSLIASVQAKYQNSTASRINRENLTLRLLQNHDRVIQALSDLEERLRSGKVGGISREAVKELKGYYWKEYYSVVKQVIHGTRSFSSMAESLSAWPLKSEQIGRYINAMEKVALRNTLSTASAIKREATTTMIANTFLIFLCMLMAYATLKIARKIQYQSNHDDLTDIPNRRYFKNSLKLLQNKTDLSAHEKLVLMTLDLDGFKSVNDTMGHVAGDTLLKQVAARLNSIRTGNMILARMGGDEFSLVYRTNNAADAYQVACKIREVFVRPFNIDNGLVNIGTSIGYSVFPDDADTIEELQITADFAMFSAKQSPGKSIQPFEREVATQYRHRIQIEKELVRAISNNELELHYQPQVNLARGTVGSVEALVRWNHPQRGTIPPNEFITIAEDAGLMPRLGSWVLDAACRQAAVWRNTPLSPIRIAVNVSLHQVMQNDFVRQVVAVTEYHGIPADMLELEITESVVMSDISRIAECLKELKRLGFRIALDDFGTGHSSLSQLQNLPLDTLKIDRSFISKLDGDSGNVKSVTATIASIAEIYGLETVAEGIETDGQLAEVNNLGIDIAQGFLYSRPLPVNEIPDAVAAITSFLNDNRKSA